MSQRGRPRNARRSVHIAIAGWLHPEFDADIIAWWSAIPAGQHMTAFKMAVRNGGLAQGQALEPDKLDAVQSAAEDILSHWEF